MNDASPPSTPNDDPVLKSATNKAKKISQIKKYLQLIKSKSILHRMHYVKFRKYDRWSKLLVTFLSALSVSSTSTGSFSQTSYAPYLVATSVICSSLTTVVSAMTNVMSFSDREHSHQTTWLQLNDLYRSVSQRVLENHLTSDDCSQILKELSNCLGLIEDNALSGTGVGDLV